MIRVLFVCTGNICRSPMAEAVFRHLVTQAGLSQSFEIASAGTTGYHVGERAHSGTLDILRTNGIAHQGRARLVERTDLRDFDYVLALDRSHLVDLARMYGTPAPHIRMFLAAANKAGTVTETEVPDPYYNGKFSEVYELVMRGCQALLAEIRHEQQL